MLWNISISIPGTPLRQKTWSCSRNKRFAYLWYLLLFGFTRPQSTHGVNVWQGYVISFCSWGLLKVLRTLSHQDSYVYMYRSSWHIHESTSLFLCIYEEEFKVLLTKAMASTCSNKIILRKYRNGTYWYDNDFTIWNKPTQSYLTQWWYGREECYNHHLL